MRHIALQAPGGTENMLWRETALPDPAPGEAQIRHEAIGVNYIDIYHRTGLYKQPAYPGGLGMEAAGIVEKTGPGVTGLTPGLRVAYVAPQPGSYATHRNMPADRLVPLPDWLDGKTAAALLLQGLTAQYLVHAAARLQSGQSVLLHAAAGGVGLLLAQWARQIGATVIGTVGSAEKAAIAQAHGCHHVINIRAEDCPARIRALTGGHGVDIVYDSVGKDTFAASLQALKPRGMLVSFGQASGPVPPFDLAQLAAGGSLYLTRPSLFHYIATPEELMRRAAHLFLVLKAGTLRPPPVTSFSLQDAAKAHQTLESRATTGKLLLIP